MTKLFVLNLNDRDTVRTLKKVTKTFALLRAVLLAQTTLKPRLPVLFNQLMNKWPETMMNNFLFFCFSRSAVSNAIKNS